MAFEYGSIDLGIKNPFKLEGLARSLRGLAVTALGALCLLDVPKLAQDEDRLAAWIAVAVGVVLLATGIRALGQGIYQMARFYTGRLIPTSLAENVSHSERGNAEPLAAYDRDRLRQMLYGRKNPTFREPEGWFSRLIHSLLPGLLFLPYLYRNLASRISKAVGLTIFAGLCYGFAAFSAGAGLTDFAATNALDWMALALVFALILIWWGCRSPLDARMQENLRKDGAGGIAIWLAFSILLPFGLDYIHRNVAPLPSPPTDSTFFIVALALLATVSLAITFSLIYSRMRAAQPTTEVSEHIDNWQEDIHPQEIFINFDNMVMTRRRYKEVPNRVYIDFDAKLVEEGSNDKGRFSGEVLQETQPAFRAIPAHPQYKTAKIVATSVGHLLLFAAAWLLYDSVDLIAQVPVVADEAAAASLAADLTKLGIGLLLSLLFGSMLSNIAHAFWSEMQFTSLLAYFKSEGTYSESKLSSGKAWDESMGSENKVVRSSITSRFLLARVVSSTFVESGVNGRANPRLVLEMAKDDEAVEAMVRELHDFIRKRKKLANITNEEDLAAASEFIALNAKARELYKAPASPEKTPPAIDTPRREVIEEGAAPAPEQADGQTPR